MAWLENARSLEVQLNENGLFSWESETDLIADNNQTETVAAKTCTFL